MGYKIDEKFVVAIASSALFDLSESDKVFQEKGENEYRKYQREHENQVLKKGVAFPLIKRLLSVNIDFPPNEAPVEVVLLSRNDPDTGLRVFKSIQHYDLQISRAVFTTGNNPFIYMDAFNASLFLSANPKDVREAVDLGLPAGCVYPSDYIDDDKDDELRLAFDFDGIIGDDSAEQIYQEHTTIEPYHVHEISNAAIPLPPGPLNRFFREISNLQKKVIQRHKDHKEYKSKIRIAIATARNAPAHERVISTLREQEIQVDVAFFLGGIEKRRVLEVFKPHIFFDDQVTHVEGVSRIAPCVHVPFGITNVNQKLES